MRELFETRESCVRGSNSRTYTLSQAQTACLYIHNLRHARTHGDAKMQYTPHTSLINKGQLAIIISIFNQSPVVLLCGLSFDNWLSPALSLSFSLSLSSLLMQLSLHLSCFMSRSCALPIYVINIWARAPCFSTSLYPSPSRLTMSSLHPPIPPSLLSNSILPHFPSLSLSASSLHPPPSLYLWWMHPLINLDVFPLAVFFHRPSNLSLIAINHWGKQMLGTKATWGGGAWVCTCVYVCTAISVHMCVHKCVQQGGGSMKLSVSVPHKSWVPAGCWHEPWAARAGGVRKSSRVCLYAGDFCMLCCTCLTLSQLIVIPA